jgi:hypothetical protein
MEGRLLFAFFTVPIFGRLRLCVEQRRQRAELRFIQLRVETSIPLQRGPYAAVWGLLELSQEMCD